MTRANHHWKNSLVGWLISIPVWLALVYLDHGKGAAFLNAHLWLCCFGPLLLIFLVLFVRAYYLQYKQ